MADPTEELTTTEARGGDGNPANRGVLYFSLALIVVIFGVILWIAA